MRLSAWWVCLLIPVLYLAAIYLRQPDDRLSGPEGLPLARHRLLYDDYDSTAYALRGLNAWFGRPPGRLQEPPHYEPLDFAVLLQTAPSVGRERSPFFLEYPTVTLWFFEIPFLLPPALSPSSVSQALADGWHTNVVEHEPQTALERFIWRKLRFAVRTYEAIGIAALMALMVVVRRGYGQLLPCGLTTLAAPLTRTPLPPGGERGSTVSLPDPPAEVSSLEAEISAVSSPEVARAIPPSSQELAPSSPLSRLGGRGQGEEGNLSGLETFSRRHDGNGQASGTWPALLLLLPASLYFSANRFDVLPALLVACSLAALGRDRSTLSGCLLAVATLVKLYPVCIAMVIVVALSRNPRRLGRWLAAFVPTGLLVLVATVPQFGCAGCWVPYWYQFNRTQDSYDASFYGVLWPVALASNPMGGKAFRLGTVLCVLMLALWSRPRRMDDLLRCSAAVLIALVSVQAFYSPQWILWLAPLLLPLGQRHAIFAAGYALLDVITYLTFPVVSDWPMSSVRAYGLDSLVWARAIVLCALLIALIAGQWRSRYRVGSSGWSEQPH
jgi:hypothetical protein